MEIYRGPDLPLNYDSSPGFKTGEPGHDLVDQIDLSTSAAWSGKMMIKVDLSKKKHAQRKSVAHIVFTENDVVGLFESMIKGLQEKRRLAEEASRIISCLPIHAIGTVANGGNIKDDMSQALADIRKLFR